jgi:hypothetical protein
LLQNAEDNSYSRARFTGAKPYIKFTIRPRKIVIDSNEDGFTTENVRAICKIGESSKTREGEQYFIGENGIGFKSVFMVASKVHIQSGPFSFSFEHGPGEQGMGMIAPKWEPSDVVLAEPLTRITLTLLDSLNLDDFFSQFDDLPRTLLLFMKKLDRIIIDADLRDVDGSAMKPNTRVRSIITYSSDFNQITGKAKITVSMDAIERPVSNSFEYRIARKRLCNLPADAQRDYNPAEVMLVFPVFEIYRNDQLEFESEQIHAFVPVHDLGSPVSVAETKLISMLTTNSSLSTQTLLRRQFERMPSKVRETKLFLRAQLKHLWMQSCNSVNIQLFNISG